MTVFGCLLALVVSISSVAGGLNFGRMHAPRARNLAPASNVQSSHRSTYALFKSALKQYIRAFGDAPLVAQVVHNPSVKRLLSSLPGSRALYYESEWDRKHPFDRAYGTDTSGFLYGEELLTGHPAEEHGSPYAGAQPSVLRSALRTLPDLDRCTFVDLGCGKGRPMLVASEFPFRDILGVELSPPLAAVARRNAEHMAKHYPQRTRVRVDEGDATVYPMPAGDIVLFVYNSFDRELMQKVVAGVEAAIRSESRRMFVVYCNPVSGDCFDASPLLVRRFAATLPYSIEERGYAPDSDDAVIIWQGGEVAAMPESIGGKIVIVKERWRCELHA